ncbi:MAG: hypothetical protein NT075_30965, partial [Chloroflexi bacterium]|nr:hypothetical protein [Chloroflexota bacterium]
MSAIKHPRLWPIVVLLLIGWLGGLPTSPAVQAQTTNATAQPVIGRLRFTDNEAARTGSFVLQIDPLTPPPAGSHYELWLRAGNSVPLLNLGTLKLTNQRVSANGRTNQPLLNTYDTLLVSVELDQAKHTTISSQIVLSATLPTAILTPVRQLFFASKLNNKGFLSGAAEQIQIAVQHSGFLNDALAKNDFAEAQRHAEHIVNILDGKDGILYSDLNRDGQIQNPGDGFGIRVYVADATEQIATAAKALNAASAQADHEQAQLARSALEDGQKRISQASEKTLQIFAADTVTEAQTFVGQLKPLLEETQTDIANASAASLQVVEFRFYAQPGAAVNATTPLPTKPNAPSTVMTTTVAPTAKAIVTNTVVLTPTTTPSPIPTLIATVIPTVIPSVIPTVIPTVTPTLKALPPPAAITQTTELTAGAVWTNPVDGGVYVYVVGGEFTMGADGAKAISPLEQPAHKVT